MVLMHHDEPGIEHKRLSNKMELLSKKKRDMWRTTSLRAL